MVEFRIERDHLHAELLEDLRREGAGRAVAAGGNDTELARDLGAVGEVADVAGGEILDEKVGATADEVEIGFEDDLLQRPHLVGAEGDRALGAHLHAGPAIVVMARGDHGDAGHVQFELGEIGHR